MGVRTAIKDIMQHGLPFAKSGAAPIPGAQGGDEGRLIHHPLLRPRIAQVIEAAADRMFPEGGAIPYSARDVDLTAYMLDFLGKAPKDKANLICLLMLGYEFGFPALFGKGLRFTKMPPEKQTALLEAMHDSSLYPFRILNFCFRMFLTFGYLADERVLQEMGYFKLHAYPSDSRLIQILKDLPWEVRPAPAGEESSDPVTGTEELTTEAPEAAQEARVQAQ